MYAIRSYYVAVGKPLMNTKEMLKAEEGDVVEIERVIMEPGIYPRMWKRRNKGNKKPDVKKDVKK